MMGALEMCAQEIPLKGKSSRSELLVRPSGHSGGLQNTISILSLVSLGACRDGNLYSPSSDSLEG